MSLRISSRSLLTTLGALVLAIAASTPVSADTVQLHGSRVPLSNCTIQEIRGGRVYFVGVRERREWRELDDVAALGFDGLPELDRAERLWMAQNQDAGLAAMLEALVASNTEVREVWVRSRLVSMHQRRGEFVQASGHAAFIFRLRDEPYWRRLEPVGSVNRVTPLAAREATKAVSDALRVVRDRTLRDVLTRLQARLAPLRAQADAAPVVETVSGIPVAEIGGGAPRKKRPGAVTETSPTPPTKRPSGSASSPVYIASDPDTIEALLEQGRFEEASRRCEQAEAGSEIRDMSHFLYQYGRSLTGAGRPKDAAVKFMRCAILYAVSPCANPSLVETALIYQDAYDDVETARRLLDRAIERGVQQGQTALVDRARKLRGTLPPAERAQSPAREHVKEDAS